MSIQAGTYYTLGMEANGQLVFISGVETEGLEKPKIKFTDDSKEMFIEKDVEVVEKWKDTLRSKGVNVEVIEIEATE